MFPELIYQVVKRFLGGDSTAYADHSLMFMLT